MSSAVTIASPSDGVSSDSVIASKIADAVSAVMFSRTAGDVARSCASELLTPDEMMSATLASICAGGSVATSVMRARSSGLMVSVFLVVASGIVVVDVVSGLVVVDVVVGAVLDVLEVLEGGTVVVDEVLVGAMVVFGAAMVVVVLLLVVVG